MEGITKVAPARRGVREAMVAMEFEEAEGEAMRMDGEWTAVTETQEPEELAVVEILEPEVMAVAETEGRLAEQKMAEAVAAAIVGLEKGGAMKVAVGEEVEQSQEMTVGLGFQAETHYGNMEAQPGE